MPDPLNDPAFANRLAKLLPMLGSGQAEEADVARRKLIEHLGAHGLTLSDLALRLQRPATLAAPAAAAGSREADRQVATLKAVLSETAAELTQARAVERELQAAVDRLAALSSRLQRARNRARLVAIGASTASGVAVVLLILPLVRGMLLQQPKLESSGMPLFMENGDQAQRHALLPPAPGELPGQAAVADLPIRYEPRDDAGVRAYLTRGTPVVVMREVQIGTRTWLFVRSASGMGWARSGDVMH